MPAILTPDAGTAERVLEFFAANIRNPNTRKAYARAIASFAAWCERHGIAELGAVRPTHIATYIEELQTTLAARSDCAQPRRDAPLAEVDAQGMPWPRAPLRH
jgi:site-specific recombinase XerD